MQNIYIILFLRLVFFFEFSFHALKRNGGTALIEYGRFFYLTTVN